VHVTIAIIGAGIAGVVLARRLREADHAVTIFEKSRGAGGRMATRRAHGMAFDHGAPCFTAQTERFRAYLEPLMADGLVLAWRGRFAGMGAEDRFVAAPAMNALAKALADGVEVRTQTHAAAITAPHVLHDADGAALGRFDWIISTAPGPQTAALFGERAPVPLAPEQMTAAFTTMLGFAEAHDPGWDMAEFDDPVIASIMLNSAKPGREGSGAAFVIHARSDWSEPRIDEAPDAVQPLLTEAFTRLTGVDAQAATYAETHRWRYAHANDGIPGGYILAPNAGLAACGDWCMGGGVEAAFTSAMRLADALVG